jgi:hypothetical protein
VNWHEIWIILHCLNTFFFHLCLHIWSLLTFGESVTTPIWWSLVVFRGVLQLWAVSHWWSWYYLQSESSFSVEVKVWISEQKGPYINVTVADTQNPVNATPRQNMCIRLWTGAVFSCGNIQLLTPACAFIIFALTFSFSCRFRNYSLVFVFPESLLSFFPFCSFLRCDMWHLS